jgi:hypothetical protein
MVELHLHSPVSNNGTVLNYVILLTVLYGSESWTLIKAHEALLGGFDRKILRIIHGTVQIDSVWRRRHDKELYSLFNDVDIIKRIKGIKGEKMKNL